MAKSSIINSINFNENRMFAKDIYLNMEQAKALAQIIKSVKADKSKHILKVSIIDCGTKDAIFSEILAALVNQGACKSLTYIGGEMGQNSLDKLREILLFNTSHQKTPIEKLTLSNIKFPKETVFRNFITDMQENENKI